MVVKGKSEWENKAVVVAVVALLVAPVSVDEQVSLEIVNDL